MNLAEIIADLESNVPGILLKEVRGTLLIENPDDLPKAAAFLKESEKYRMDYLSSVTGADYLTFLECVYHLYSMEERSGCLVLRVRTNREQPKIPSLVPIYRGAEFQEREAYDMYGIVFEKHPDLRRIFMWDGFEGFPMRKDYVQEDSETLETEDIAWLEKHGAKIPETMRQKAEELKKSGKRATAEPPKAGA